MKYENLKIYKAKSNGENIYEHNKKLQQVLNNIIDVFNLDEQTIKKIKKCIVYHDIGKVTKEMQDCFDDVQLLNTKRKVRHELYGTSVVELDLDEKLAILTHHKNLDYFKKYIDNEIYTNELKEVSKKLEVELENISDFLKKINRMRYQKDLSKIENILLKGYLNYCDHLGSAGILNIEKGFDSIQEFKIPEGFNYNSIQEKVLNLQDKKDIMINAMTGLGKTATSMYWSDLVQNDAKSKRIYYILPFTASINSLFNDFQERKLSVSMLHSEAEYFLTKNEEFENIDIKELYSLFKKSNKQINVCTIFQIIKSAFSCKRFEMLLVQLKNSIFIIDEIHCFDIKELCFILEFLKFAKEKLKIDICIMSASMPTCLQKLILDKLNIDTLITADKKDLIQRHSLIRVNRNIIDDLEIVKGKLNENKQVLICVNSVDLAQELYKEFKDDYKCKLIHGRFNTRDRENAEKNLKTSQLLIGTQAIEVSLDISYDIMFTELAPLDALLQRFGRVNRKGEKGISDIYIYNNTSEKIYLEEILERTDSTIEEIIKEDNRIVLEDKVNYYLDKVYLNIDMTVYNEYADKFNLMIKNLKLGVENKNATDDMCENDNIKVLPICLYNEYITCMSEKKYLEAKSLLVSIKNNRLKWNKDRFNYDDKYKIYITSYLYKNDSGLYFNKLEDNII